MAALYSEGKLKPVMASPFPVPKGPSVSDYLAAERTFLAWIRTGLALMGFGFVVARFGLFLERLRLIEPNLESSSSHNGVSIWFGTGLIIIGVCTNLFACWNHVRLVRQLNQGAAEFTRPSRAGLAVGIFLAFVGLAMAIYLVSV
jgi:putative membrane protein